MRILQFFSVGIIKLAVTSAGAEGRILLQLSCNKSLGLWSDILAIVLVGVVITVLSNVIGVAQTTLIARKGAVMVAKLASLNSIANIATCLNPVVQSLALVALGMSICYKKLTKEG